MYALNFLTCAERFQGGNNFFFTHNWQNFQQTSFLILLCCSTPRSETHLPRWYSCTSVCRSTSAQWRWAKYRIRWNGKLRWAPTLVSAWPTRLNKEQSSAQHVDHQTQNSQCLSPTRVAFEPPLWKGIVWIACETCNTGNVYNTLIY